MTATVKEKVVDFDKNTFYDTKSTNANDSTFDAVKQEEIALKHL